MNKKAVRVIIFLTLFVCIVAVISLVAWQLWPKNSGGDKGSNSNAGGTTNGQLFDSSGNYRFSKSDIKKGNIYSFFGHDWYMVAGSGDIATFWMVTPMAGHSVVFDNKPTAGNNPNASTMYSNGYSSMGQVGSSYVRTYMQTTVVSALGIGSLGNAAGKQYVVLPKNTNLNSGTSSEVTMVVYNITSSQYGERIPGEKMAANYNLNSDSDVVWLPSWEEVGQNGSWGLTDNKYRGWTLSNGVPQYAWLRSAFPDDSRCADAVGYKAGLQAGDNNAVYSVVTTETMGIRPAIHLNISSAGGQAQTQYMITWKNHDGSVLGTVMVNAGTKPTYTGATPAKAADATNEYKFLGWTPAVSAANANATYTATFKAMAIGSGDGNNNDGGFLSNTAVQVTFIVLVAVGVIAIIVVTSVCVKNARKRAEIHEMHEMQM